MSRQAAQCTGPSWTSRVPSGTSHHPLPVSPRASLGLWASLGFELGTTSGTNHNINPIPPWTSRVPSGTSLVSLTSAPTLDDPSPNPDPDPNLQLQPPILTLNRTLALTLSLTLTIPLTLTLTYTLTQTPYRHDAGRH